MSCGCETSIVDEPQALLLLYHAMRVTYIGSREAQKPAEAPNKSEADFSADLHTRQWGVGEAGR